MRPASLTQLLYSVTVSHTECAPDTASASCVPVARLRSALLRENWTAEELQHVHACASCQQQALHGQGLLYHPPLTALVQFVRASQADADLDYHLQQDACRRCIRVVTLLGSGTLLSRLGTQQLDTMLNAAEVLPLPPPGSHSDAYTVEGERYRARVMLGEKPSIRVESVGTHSDVAYVTGAGVGEQFVSVFAAGDHPQAISLRVASLPEWGELLVVPGEPLLVSPTARALWNRFQAKANVDERRSKRERH